jgi:hypothetical protein
VRNAAAFVLLCVAVDGCGKKGAPLPPILRIPGLVGDAAATRVENEVFVRFKVPTANLDGHTPADVTRVEVFAITATRPPTDQDDPEDLRSLSTLVGSEQVRRPPPPLPPVKPGEPEPPPLPPEPGVDQGSDVLVREAITEEMRKEIELPELPGSSGDDGDSEAVPGPLLAPNVAGATRYYYAVAVSPNGRYGPHGSMLPVPLGPTSTAPSQPELSHDATSITIKWLPPRDARGLGLADTPGVLPSKPIVVGPPATTYDVYEAPSAGNQSPAMPVPLTQAPVGGTSFTHALGGFGVERCFYVRSVDVVDGYHVRGPASPTTCLTPKDTYPPTPPKSLAAVASGSSIHLIWDPSDSPDVVGYLVLRSRLPDDTLQPAMAKPIAGTKFVDEGVRADVTYGYVVVAVDGSGNRSEPSNRVEETARQ